MKRLTWMSSPGPALALVLLAPAVAQQFVQQSGPQQGTRQDLAALSPFRQTTPRLPARADNGG